MLQNLVKEKFVSKIFIGLDGLHNHLFKSGIYCRNSFEIDFHSFT